MNKAVFLDRDGVINRKAPDNSYITDWSEVVILPGVANAIQQLNRRDYLVIVVTNQRCVAKGEVTLPKLEHIHRELKRKLASEGAKVNAIYFCPHEINENCNCRKPNPGMLSQAIREFDIDAQASWMIGDNMRDINAGRNARCRTILISPHSNENAGAASEIIVKDLPHAVKLICGG